MDPGHITSMAIIGFAVHYEDGGAPDRPRPGVYVGRVAAP